MILSLSDTAHANYTLRTLHSSSTCTGPVLISIFTQYVLISNYPGLPWAALICPRFLPPFSITESELQMLTCATSIQLCNNKTYLTMLVKQSSLSLFACLPFPLSISAGCVIPVACMMAIDRSPLS